MRMLCLRLSYVQISVCSAYFHSAICRMSFYSFHVNSRAQSSSIYCGAVSAFVFTYRQLLDASRHIKDYNTVHENHPSDEQGLHT
jgi:hypothetical protein